jgi:guanine deaminase
LQGETVIMPSHLKYMKLAIREAAAAMRSGAGGPFGAIIVREGEIIGQGHNTVLLSHDPTAHAEVNAIRDACSRIKEHHLTGAVIYSNFEPCPMCLSAIYWADIRSVYYCAGREDAEKAGFMDNHLYQELSLPPESREIRSEKVTVEEMSQLLDEWDRKEGKIIY